MKLILENWRKYITEDDEGYDDGEGEEVKISSEDGKKTFRIDGGRIVVIENSKWADGAHSIYNFFVDEDKRGEGLGKKLIQIVLDEYPGEEISAQVSSLASLKVFLDLGFKPSEKPDASFEEAKEIFDHNYGSLNLRINDETPI
jgi:GNAT superfamily N-acetyltransferase